MSAVISLSESRGTLVELLTRRDNNGLPCIMKAITRQSLSCIALLLDSLQSSSMEFSETEKMAALQSHNKRNILHAAAQLVRPDEEILNTIQKYSILKELVDSPDNNGTTPLIVASQFKNDSIALWLVKNNAKIDHIDQSGYSPMYWVIANGNSQMLKLFFDHGESPPPLVFCISLGNGMRKISHGLNYPNVYDMSACTGRIRTVSKNFVLNRRQF